MIIKNAKVYDSDFKFSEHEVVIDGEYLSENTSDERVLDAKDLLIIPGFIDLHLHGAFNADFMDGTDDAISTILKFEAKQGVTSVALASMTMGKDTLEKAFKSAASFRPKENEASLEGIYMEGPFISPNKIGAQNPQFLMPLDLDFFKTLQKVSGNLIKCLVVAPELEGAIDFIKEVKDKVRVSLGHTNCDYQTASCAFDAGARELTHTFNAMPPMLHRAPGPIVAASENAKVLAELICDGVHVNPAMVRMAFKLFSKDNIVMISDSMMATGLENGTYALGGQKVLVNENVATLEDGTIAGSVTNLFSCFKLAVNKMGIKLEDAIKACTYNPDSALNIHDKVGQIKPGFRADLLLIDNKLNLKGVILRGQLLK